MKNKKSNRKTILMVFGTRPEAIKMAPVYHALMDMNSFNVKVCVTAQHREMLDQVLEHFSITPDFDLDLMRENQTLNGLCSSIIDKIDSVILNVAPDLLLVHGDTCTTIAASMAAYFRRVEIGHVEAGLRSGSLEEPWPEEANRRLTSVIANYHFAPSQLSFANLVKEGIDENKICVTGNTVIDALCLMKEKIKVDVDLTEQIKSNLSEVDFSKKIVLVTCHRRENFGSGLINICEAIGQIADSHSDCDIVFPVHLNPQIMQPVKKLLNSKRNVKLIAPLDYAQFVYLMMACHVILTDSGGIQEEAPTLGKPILLMRDTTERPEAVMSGTVKLVGSRPNEIVESFDKLISNRDVYKKMSSAANPYGQGDAAKKIASFLSTHLVGGDNDE